MNESSDNNYEINAKQALDNIINAISLEQVALNSILDTEKDLLQKAFGQCNNMFEFLSVNDSVNNVVKNIVRLQTLTQLKLDDASDLLQKTLEFYQQSDGSETANDDSVADDDDDECEGESEE